MKKQKIYKEFLNPQCEFDHKYACWANNHNGWAKMKKRNKRIAKRREKEKLKNFLKEEKNYDGNRNR